MKNTFLDITHKISRSLNRIRLELIEANADYYICSNSSWFINKVSREMKDDIDLSKLIKITINQQYIAKKYYIIEPSNTDGITIKFIKSQLPFSLQVDDVIELYGQITKYA